MMTSGFYKKIEGGGHTSTLIVEAFAATPAILLVVPGPLTLPATRFWSHVGSNGLVQPYILQW